MSRPCKRRRIMCNHNSIYFKPSGIPIRELKEVELDLSEFEAVRLKDLENLRQEECAKKMDISQPTFYRIISSARKKISDSIINGKALKIEKFKFIKE